MIIIPGLAPIALQTNRSQWLYYSSNAEKLAYKRTPVVGDFRVYFISLCLNLMGTLLHAPVGITILFTRNISVVL